MWGMVKPSIRGSPAVVSMILARRGTAKDDQRERNQRLSRNSRARRGTASLGFERMVHGHLGAANREGLSQPSLRNQSRTLKLLLLGLIHTLIPGDESTHPE